MFLDLQTQIMKEYPAELTVVFFYNLTVSIIAAIVALITEGTSSAWLVRPNIALASILCSVRDHCETDDLLLFAVVCVCVCVIYKVYNP